MQVFAAYLPQGDILPRDMRRWAADSARALVAAPAAPRCGNLANLASAERHLRRVVSHSVHTLETTQTMRDDARLQELSHAVSVALYRQEELAGFYNRSVAEYNTELAAPCGKLLGGLFGFCPAASVR